MTGNFDANKYVGLRYLAGGRDVDGEVSGVDCWGLVRLVYEREFGINLPGHDGVNRDTTSDEDLADYAAAQMEDWERVRNPEPGDMVRLRIKGNPMHVGIVTAPGDFLHVRAGNDSVVDRYRSRLWADRIEGFYRYSPRSTGVVVSGCPHPLRMARIDGEAMAGCSLASVIYGHCATAGVPDDLVQYGIAFVNGRRVALEDWTLRILVDGDRVEFRMLPGKEGGGLRVILTIAVMVVAAWATAGASAYFASAAGGGYGTAAAGAMGAMAGMAVTMAGTALVNAIAPIRPPQLGSDDKGTSYKPQYMLAGGQNQATPYAAFPIVLGHHDFTGPLGANSYISSNGTDRYLHMLIVWGYGPLDISNLRIGSTPLTDYQDIDVFTLEGDAAEYVDGKLDWSNPEVAALLNVYGSDINQQSPEVELDTVPVQRTTVETDCTRLRVLLSFPQGLVDIDEEDGRKQTETVTVVFEYRRIGYFNALGVWVPVVESFKDNWSNIPGVGWNKSSDKTGLDMKSIVVLRGSVLSVKTNTGGWSIQAAGIIQATWPTVAPGEILIHKIQNGALISSHNTALYTGFGVTFRTITTSRVIKKWNTLFWTSTTVTESYKQFTVASGVSAGANVYSNANNDSFDSEIILDVHTEPGQYEVQMRRTTPSRTDSAISDKVYWMMLTEEVQNRRPINPPKPMAMTALRIRATNQINGTLDGITATLATRQLQWNGSAWVAPTPAQRRNNPASLYLYALQHPASARPVPDAEIDFDALGHWYEVCADKGFIYENIITGQRPLPEVLADIAAAGRASVSNLDSKWSVTIDEPKTKIAQHFTAHNSWGFEGSRLLPKLPHGLRVNFLNREKDYQPDELIVYNDGYNADNATLFETIELPGVTSAGTLANPGPIFKLGRFHLEQLVLRPEEYYKYTEIEGLIATRGDRVKSNHDVPKWGLGSGRIKSVIGDVTGVVIDEPVQMTAGPDYTIRWRTAANETNTATITGATGVFDTLNFTTTISTNKPAEGDLFMFGELNSEAVDCLVKHVEPIGNFQARLTLVDYAPALFDAESKPFGTWESKITEPPPLLRLELTQRPLIDGVVTDEAALTRNGNTVQTNIRVKFSSGQGTANGAIQPLNKNVAMVEAQYRLDATVASGVPYKPLPLVPIKAGSLYVPATDKTTYDLRLRFIGADGRSGPWVDLPNVYVSGKTNPPPITTGFKSAASGARVTLDWDNNTDIDVTTYEVRYADTGWGLNDANKLYRGGASICYYTPVSTSNRTFYIRARDSLGNWSPTASHLFVYPAVPAPATINHSFAATSSTSAVVTLDWSDVAPKFSLKDYQLSDGTTTIYVNASKKDWPANWTDSKTFTVKARDIYGALSAAKSKVVTMSLPVMAGVAVASPLVGSIKVDWPDATKGSLPIWGYEVRRINSGWGGADFVYKGAVSGCTIPGSEIEAGVNDFFIKAIDTERHYSTAALTLNYTPALPDAPVSGDYRFVPSLTSSRVYLNWSDVKPPLGLSHYKVVGVDGATSVNASEFSSIVNWTGSKTFTVQTVDHLGNESAVLNINVVVDLPDAPSAATCTPQLGSMKIDWPDVARDTLPIWGYEVRRTNSGWGTAGFVFKGAGSSCSILAADLITGVNDFFIKSIDTVGNYSPTATLAAYTVALPDRPASLSYAFTDTALTTATVTLDWPDVIPPFGLKHYVVTYDAVSKIVNASTITLPANWLGAKTFSVKTVDLLGQVSAVRSVAATLNGPGVVTGFMAQVVDNNVLLYWTLPAKTSLPIAHVRIKRGATWATAEDVGAKAGSFTTIMETVGGEYVYWAAVVDTENHEGTPVAIPATVSQPPDYVFSGSKTSTLNGTKSNATLSDGSIVLPVNLTETFEGHFTARSWATPQAQVTAGYPIYVQPGQTTGYYEETFNFGSVFPATKATASIDGLVVSGSPTRIVTISLSDDNVTWTAYDGVTEIFGTNFQYVKVRITVTGTGADLYQIRGLTVRLDAKLKSDAGSVAALSTDASGTVANFNVGFVDVTSITVSPGGTSRISAVYDYKDSVLAGTYSVTSNVATITATAHGLIVGQKVRLNFTSGTATPGTYTVASVTSANVYTVALVTANTSGNVSTYSQGMRIYLFDSAGARYTGPASWAVRGY